MVPQFEPGTVSAKTATTAELMSAAKGQQGNNGGNVGVGSTNMAMTKRMSSSTSLSPSARKAPVLTEAELAR